MLFVFGARIGHLLPRHEKDEPHKAINPDAPSLEPDGTVVSKSSPLYPLAKKAENVKKKQEELTKPISRSKQPRKSNIVWGSGGHINIDFKTPPKPNRR